MGIKFNQKVIPTYSELVRSIKEELRLVKSGEKKSYKELRSHLKAAEKHRYLSIPIGDSIQYCKTAKQRQDCIAIAEGFLATKLVTFATLRQRGWSKKIAEKAELQSDLTVPNPHHKSTAPMHLYCLSKVIHLESRPDVQLQLEKINRDRPARSAVRQKTVEKEKLRSLHWVESLEVAIPEYSIASLVKFAVEAHNNLWASREQFDRFCSTKSNPEFLARICFNFLRHETTSYDSSLDLLFGSIGRQEASDRLKTKINNAIDQKYPNLEQQIRALP